MHRPNTKTGRRIKKESPRLPEKSRFNAWWIYYLILIFIFFFSFFFSSGPTSEISWQQFEKNMLRRHAVERIEVVNNEKAQIYIRKEFNKDPAFRDVLKDNPDGPHYQMVIGSVEGFERRLDTAQAKFADKDRVEVFYIRRNSVGQMLLGLLPFLFLILLWQYMIRRANSGGGSIFSFGKSSAMLLENENKSTVTFDDVAGVDEAKVEIKEIVDFLKDPKAFTRLGAKIPKGVIIVGPPGTGKTLLVKAVAGEAKVPFFSISGSEFVEMFVGVGASRVRDLFRRAKEKAPCIVFIDEIDAVGRSRGKNTFYTGANDERESTLNQLLTEMDGFGTNSGVIVLAATNRADMLDPALLRPGRFDRHIYLELPNFTERIGIFKVHLKPLVLDPAIDVDFLAGQTPGFSGADIANICNEAALIAARHKKSRVDKQDFLDAIDRIVAGLERRSRILSPDEKRTIAYHEAGHALVSWVLKTVDPLTKVSIIPRGKTLGAAWYLPEERQLRTATAFNEKLSAGLGGRAAEELILGDVSSGALDDLEKVTREAYMMVAYYGFNKKIGNTSFYDSTGMQTGFQKPYSEETGKLIDEEVRKLVGEAYQRSLDILTEHLDQLHAVAGLLLDKEVIFKEDLEKILGKRSGNDPVGTGSKVLAKQMALKK